MGLALFLIIILLILAFIVIKPAANISNTSTVPIDDDAVITIYSPHDGATYNVSSLPLYFTVQTNDDFFSVRYILNNQRPVTIPAWTVNQTSLKGYFPTYNYTYYYPRLTAVSNTVLFDLANGDYNLTIENCYDVSTRVQVTNSTSITFTIDTSFQNATPVFKPSPEPYPKLTIDSFDSPTKNVATNDDSYAQVDVTFNLTAIPSWVGYSIDGKSNQTISGFSTIYNAQASINVPLGNHTITLYTNDTAGNWAIPVAFYSTVVSFKDYVAGKSASNSLLASSIAP